jgi:hypothetical protein
MTQPDLLALYLRKVESIDTDHARHVVWMIHQIPTLGDEGKVNRWMGFIQGYFWETGLYTIDEMREHVRLLLIDK